MSETTRPKDWPREWYLYETANEKMRRTADRIWGTYRPARFYSLAALRARYDAAFCAAASRVGSVA